MTADTLQSYSSVLQASKDKMNELNELRNKKPTTLKRNLMFGGMVLGGVLLAGAFATQIIGGVVAIGASAALLVGGHFAIKAFKKLDPVVQQKMNNLAYNLQVKEARKNAVAQLENQVIINRQRLKKAEDSRDRFGGMVESLETKLANSDKNSSWYDNKQKMYQRVKDAYDMTIENIATGQRAHKEFEKKVVEYKDMQQFADVATEALDGLNAANGSKMEDMLVFAAFDQIETEFNTALVSIENKTRDMQVEMED